MEERVLLGEMTREEVAELAPRATAIVPVAATEQHGPHLPLLVDTILCTEVAGRVARAVAGDLPVAVTPTLPVGYSRHHFVFNALSLSSHTFLSVLTEVGESLVRAGFRRIFILNGHGGNDEAIRSAARDLNLGSEIHTGACSYWTPALPALRELGIEEAVGPVPGHAGGFETAAMLAVRPDLVRVERYPTSSPAPLSRNPLLNSRAFVQHPGDWFQSGGFSEPPVKATADWGERALAVIVREVAAVIRAFHADSQD